MLLLRIVSELGTVTEKRAQFEWVEEEQDHVVKLDPVLLTFVNGILVVSIGHTAEEIHELRV